MTESFDVRGTTLNPDHSLSYLFYVYLSFHILHPNRSVLSLLSSQPVSHPLCSPPLPFPFRKDQTYKAYQPSMACQVAVRLGISPHITAEKGNPMRGKMFQKQAKVSETVPMPTVRCPIGTPSYTTVTTIQRPYIRAMKAIGYWFSFCELLLVQIS